MKMPFGKYYGKELQDIPDEYLNWALDNVKFKSPELKKSIENELTTREAQEKDLTDNYSYNEDPDPFGLGDPDDDVPF